MKYSKNGGEKITMSSNTYIDVVAGDKVAFYGNGTSITSYNGTKFNYGDAEVKVYGNIMSLVKETDFATANTLTKEYCFYELFYYYSYLKDASGLLLPATTLVEGCYDAMFMACYSLTAAPELKATSLAVSCYYSMFNGCTSLTTAPELKATSLATYCYYHMFTGCTSLISAYVKAAYSIANYECNDMFTDCSATGAVLHTTTASKDSWDGVMGSGKTWSNWTAVGDWN